MTDLTAPGDGAASARADLVSSLDIVRGRLGATNLPLEGAGVSEARVRRRELIDQLDDYLLPRLRSAGAPLLVVVGGSTGAGKSTLVNSLLGAPLTRPGVLRPTTRSPVLVHHPADEPWFSGDRVFPTLPRLRTTRDDAAAPLVEDATTVRALRLAPFAGMPPGMALLDAPDIDSLETANRDLAAQLLAAADLWLRDRRRSLCRRRPVGSPSSRGRPPRTDRSRAGPPGPRERGGRGRPGSTDERQRTPGRPSLRGARS